MYKVKRFSQCSISEVDVKWYSCNEYQKEYNVINDVFHSGPKRTTKKIVGKIRTNIAGKLKPHDSSNTAIRNLSVNKPLTHTELENKLINAAENNHKSLVLNQGFDQFTPNAIVDKNEAKKLINSLKDENSRNFLTNEMKNKNHMIFHDPKSGTSLLAHEIGHAMNSNSRNPIKKFLDKIGKSKETGIFKVANEKSASKNALKLMKNNEASKSELIKFEDNLANALDTYRHTDPESKINKIRRSLYDKIQIPSVKNDSSKMTRRNKYKKLR